VTAFHETAPKGPTAALAAAMKALVPVLQTRRLTLRAPAIGDFDAFAAMVLGPRGRHFGDCQTRAEAWAEFIQLTGTWYLRGHGAWTVTDRTDGTVLGFVQIGAEPGDAEPELGFIVSEAAEGRGIAREAAEAVRAQALGRFALPALVSYVDPENVRSIALAKNLGATRDPAAEAALPDGDRPLVFRHAPRERPA
jgi:RimJ/RimL family protein N-acetyltransferase